MRFFSKPPTDDELAVIKNKLEQVKEINFIDYEKICDELNYFDGSEELEIYSGMYFSVVMTNCSCVPNVKPQMSFLIKTGKEQRDIFFAEQIQEIKEEFYTLQTIFYLYA